MNAALNSTTPSQTQFASNGVVRFSPVGPIGLLEGLKELEILGDYLLLLAHEVLKTPKRYVELLKGAQSTYIILDNGVIELGQAVGLEQMVDARDIVRDARGWAPDMIVLPDVFDDMEGTITNAFFFHDIYMQNFERLMAIPHGKTWAQFMLCTQRLAELEGVKMWGIPRILQHNLGTRSWACHYATLQSRLPVHLLGFSGNVKDDMCTCWGDSVGIDSSLPLVLGQLELDLKALLAPGFHTRGEKSFWNSQEPITTQTQQLLHNVRELINGRVDIV